MSTLNITPQWLEQQIQRAAYCSNATIPGDHFRALMDMAARVKGYEVSGLRDLREKYQYEDEIKLTGNELRVLLMLAKQARRLRPQLRVVPSQRQN